MANHTILVIDYEPRSIGRMTELLEGAGYEIHVANDGVAGLVAFDKIKPAMVLIEAMLPKKHGFEVCQEIKKSAHGSRTPVVITTAVYRGRKYRTQALHIHGCDEYLEKPISDEKLLETCQRLLPQAPEQDSAPARNALARAVGESHAAPSDPTEREIVDRLDAIMGGEASSDHGGEAVFGESSSSGPTELSAGAHPGIGEADRDDESHHETGEARSQVVPFDADRRRREPSSSGNDSAVSAAVHGIPEEMPRARSAAGPGSDDAVEASASRGGSAFKVVLLLLILAAAGVGIGVYLLL